MFFVFDGMDGAGKTTQLNLFAQGLTDRGHDVEICKDPGTTELGNEMRQLLLQERGLSIHVRSELLMFMTARAQLVEQIIRPALEGGKTVVCDRFVYSTVVYQGYGGNIDPDVVWQLNKFSTGGLKADLTFIFDLDAQTAQSRLSGTLDRMESRGLAYFEKIRAGFVAEAKRWPDEVALIDAAGTVEVVQQRVLAAAKYLTQI